MSAVNDQSLSSSNVFYAINVTITKLITEDSRKKIYVYTTKEMWQPLTSAIRINVAHKVSFLSPIKHSFSSCNILGALLCASSYLKTWEYTHKDPYIHRHKPTHRHMHTQTCVYTHSHKHTSTPTHTHKYT